MCENEFIIGMVSDMMGTKDKETIIKVCEEELGVDLTTSQTQEYLTKISKQDNRSLLDKFIEYG